MKNYCERAGLHRQQGVILVTSLVLLVVLTLIGLRLMTSSTLDERMAIASQEIATSVQIADSGIQALFNDNQVFVYGSAVAPTTHAFHDGSRPQGEPARALLTYSKDAGSEQEIPASATPSLVWEKGDFSRYYFNLSAEARSPAGFTRRVRAGAMAIGPSGPGS